MINWKYPSLKEALDKTLECMDWELFQKEDPVKFVQRFSNHKDKEIAGWISSSLAYGSRKVFLNVLEDIFSIMGNRPFLFVKKFRFTKDGKYFSHIRYRFNNGWDVAAVVEILHGIYQKNATLKEFFLGFDDGGENIFSMVAGGIEWMRGEMVRICKGYERRGSEFKNPFFLFPSPNNGGPMKRPMLFFRWMCRDAPPDSGLWSKEIPPSRLVMPLDVHLFRTAHRLGLLTRGSPSAKAALELTSYFRNLDPHDPTKYDFPLLSWSAGMCPPEKISCDMSVEECPLADVCRQNSRRESKT